MALPADPDDFLTLSEVADHLRVHASTVAEWVRAGKLPAVRFSAGKAAAIRVRVGALRSHIAAMEAQATVPTIPVEVVTLPAPDEREEENDGAAAASTRPGRVDLFLAQTAAVGRGADVERSARLSDIRDASGSRGRRGRATS